MVTHVFHIYDDKKCMMECDGLTYEGFEVWRCKIHNKTVWIKPQKDLEYLVKEIKTELYGDVLLNIYELEYPKKLQEYLEKMKKDKWFLVSMTDKCMIFKNRM